MVGTVLTWDMFAKDGASPAILRVGEAAEKTAAQTAKMTKSLDTAVAKAGATGKKLTTAITAPVIAAVAVSVDQAMKFQKSMTLIQTAGGETAKKAAEISAGVKKIATSTGTSLDQLGEGIYTVAKAGAQKWSAAGQLEVLRAAAQGAKAEAVPLGTAVDALSTIMLDYGAKTSDAVKYENMLIRGSGLAKTSMQEYAGALSNVVPIGAAVGLSFQEIGGSVATMTEHGVSAQRATENLRNLITNLSGQSGTASSAMQQLGINTVDLAQHLGSRGLSGTLAIVDKALATHSKDGMVVVDVHKAAALATSSLNTEMGTFTGKLKDQSKELLTGKVGIADYQKYAKSLGGTAGAGALQFLSLYKNSQGFSDQLKSGKGTITTTTAALNKMLGGITGSSVAMQIGGKYAAQNASNIREIGKASLEAGTDVLGWNKTQDLLTTRLDKAKASLQVLSVEIGTALIPAVTHVVSAVSGAVHWFENLSGTQKQMLGWGIGVAAALGPVISIGAKLALVGRGISTFTTGAVSQLARFNSRLALNADGVSGAMGKIGGALGGAAIGVAVGALTAHANAAVKAVGVLGSAAAGAAIGFGSGGGGIGAVIGGLAGGLSALATQFFTAGDAAKKQIPKIGGLTEALEADNGAVGRNTEALVANSLQSNGLYTAGLKLGISQRTLTLAAEGNTTALRMVQGAQLSVVGSAASAAAAHRNLTRAQSAQVDASAKLSSGLGDVNGQLRDATTAARNIDAGLGKVTATSRTASGGLTDAGQSAAAAAGHLQTAKSKADVLAVGLANLGKIYADPKINVDTSAALAKINALAGKISGLGTTLAISQGLKPKGFATGGGLPEGISSVGEEGAELAVKRGAHVEIIPHGPARRIAEKYKAVGIDVPGFAKGTAGSVAATQSWLRNRVDPLPYVFGAAGPGAYDCSGLVGAVIEHLTGKGKGRLFSTSNEGAVLRSLGFKKGSGGANALMVAGWNGEHTTGSVGGLKFEAFGSDGVARKDQIRVGGNARDPKSFPNVMYLPFGADGVTSSAAKPGGNPKGGASPAVSTAKAAAGLFGAGGSFGSQLISGLDVAGSSAGVASQSVAASRNAVLAGASGAVNSAITSGIAPDPTQAQLIGSAGKAGVLGNAITGAVGAQKRADIAGQNYAALTAKVTALRTAIKGLNGASSTRINNLRDEADQLAKQARGMATSTKVERAAKKSVLDHAASLRSEATELARNTAASTKSLRATLTAQLTAAQTLAASAKDAYGTISQAAKDAMSKAADYAKTLVSDVQASADTMTSSISDFKSSMQSSILGDNSISSLWSTLYGATDADGNPVAATLTALQANLDTILTNTQGFAADLNSVTAEGGNQDLITQLSSLGATAGDALAKQLIAAGPSAVKALQTTMTSIQSVASTEAGQLASSFFGPGATAMIQFVQGLQSQFPALTAALQAIVSQISTAAGVAVPKITPPPVTTPAAAAAAKVYATNPAAGKVTHPFLVNPPKFSAGVTNFGTGLALVHAGEALVNFGLPGNTVLTKSETTNALKYPAQHASASRNGRPLGDTSGLEKRLDEVVRQLIDTKRTIAATPEQNGQEMASAGAGLYRTAGGAAARQQRRQGRRAGR